MALTKVTGAGLGTVDSADLDGAVTINESSADVNFRVESNSNANMLFVNAGDDKIGIGTASPAEILHLDTGGATTTIQIDSDTESSITFNDHGGSAKQYKIGTNITDNNSQFEIRDVTAGVSRMRVDSCGNVLIGKTATGTAAGVQLEPTGTANIARSGDLCLVLDRLTNAGEIVSIRQGTTAVGGIDANSSSVDFNTSSDYRLKENVTTSWDATTRLKQLKPVRFSWKVDSKSEADTDGFLAHEVSSVVPEATSGEKDAVDADGNPKHQGIDHSKLVALLVKTVQELEARIATLESK